MRLVIISNMAHYEQNGVIVGHGSTVREINHLSTLFDEVRHIGCLHQGAAPQSFLPYTSPNIQLVPVPPSGGRRLYEKLQGVWFLPQYIRTILREFNHADVVHVRAPANIPFLGIVLLAFRAYPTRRWFKFGGSWKVTSYTSNFSKIQRWWLNKGLTQGIVTVNGVWDGQLPHIVSFHNPCLTQADIQQGKVASKNKRFDSPTRLLYVGNLTRQKGVHRLIEIVWKLHEQNRGISLDIVGGGVEERTLREAIAEYQLQHIIHLHGEMKRADINAFYAKAHLIVLPSDTEGFPKVLSEAMAFGVVPIASATGSVQYYLQEAQTGKTVPNTDIDAYVSAIVEYIENPQQWQREAQNSVQMAEQFSYDNYLHAVREILDLSESKDQ